MNDLSATFEIALDEKSKKADFTELTKTGHIFRSRFLDKCALIEGWAINILKAADAASDRGRSAKLPHLFGKKLEAVRKLAESEMSPFKSPTKVIGLLDLLEPYAQLRSALAHAVLRVTPGLEGDRLFLFHVTCEMVAPGWQRRPVFTNEEMQDALSELAKISNELSQQSLRS